MARLSDEQYAQVLMDRLRNDIAQANSMKLRGSVVSTMADEVEMAAGQLRITDDARRSMRELSREARAHLRAAKKALREPAPTEMAPVGALATA